MSYYDHVLTISVSTVSSEPEGEDVTADQIRAALINRIAGLDDAELIDATMNDPSSIEIGDRYGEDVAEQRRRITRSQARRVIEIASNTLEPGEERAVGVLAMAAAMLR